MSDQEKRSLSQTLASFLLSGKLSSYHAFAMFADDDTILRSIILFRASRASVR